jgi:diacylglycerol kinase family enzyme
VLVVLNPRASYGRARTLWEGVRDDVQARAGALRVVETTSPEDVARVVREAVAGGERVVVAAGGDGTVHQVANALLAVEGGGEVALGAVGLGSSNDFHKPFRPEAFVGRVPVRVDPEGCRPRDAIRLDVEAPDGTTHTRYAVLNASIGITAETNAVFNDATPFVRLARRLSVDAAIVAAMLTTLATFRDVPCRLSVDGTDEGRRLVSNLGVVKSRHFAGSFTYDTEIGPNDGLLGVNLCEDLSRLEAVAMLSALARGRFRGRPKTASWRARRVAVQGERPFALEMDGEVTGARAVEISVLPEGIRCCR